MGIFVKKKKLSKFHLSKEKKSKIFNNLKSFDSFSILKENKIILKSDLGLDLVNSYMPHMFEIKNKNIFDPLEIFKSENIKNNHKISNFSPILAKYIYDVYAGNGQVLDFSSGYGERLIGALASEKVEKYFGYDPCTKTFEAYKNIFQDMIEFNNIKKITIENEPFENAILPFNFFDLAFSSPPYFNNQIYSDETNQSCKKYPIKQLWKFKFLKVLIEKCYTALKPDGYFIINVANVKEYRDLEEDTFDFSLNQGFKHIKTYHMLLSSKNKSEYEPIFVFQKPSL